MPLENARCSGSPLPVQPEPVRVGVRGRVAVGGGQQDRHHAAPFGSRRPSSSTSSRANRTVSWTGGSKRSVSSTAASARPGRPPAGATCSGSPLQRGDRVADQVDRGLEPGHQQQAAGRHQVVAVSSPPSSAAASRLITSSRGSRRRSSASRRNRTASSRPACRSSCAWRTVRTPSRDWPTSTPIWAKWVASAAGMPSSRLITAIGKPLGQLGHQVEPVPPLQPVQDLGQHLLDHRGEARGSTWAGTPARSAGAAGCAAVGRAPGRTR